VLPKALPVPITVVQGNFVSKEAAAQMQVGMSRAQVKQLLGTPLLTDMFHADRWDYVFYFKRGSTNVVQQRDFVILFAGDRVASWSGGEDLPSNLELLAEIDGDKRQEEGRRAERGKRRNWRQRAGSRSAGCRGHHALAVCRWRRRSRSCRPRTPTPKPRRPPIG
jgi:Small protein A (tmRNA-binding)